MNRIQYTGLCPCGSGYEERLCCLSNMGQASLFRDQLLEAVPELLAGLREYVLEQEEAIVQILAEEPRLQILDLEIIREHPLWHLLVEWALFDAGEPTLYHTFLEGIQDRGSLLCHELCRWSSSYISLYRMEGAKGENILLRDLFTGVLRELHRCTKTQEIEAGQIVIGRLLPVASLACMGTDCFVFPPVLGDELRKKLVSLRYDQEERSVLYSGWGAFLKDNAPYLLTFLLSPIGAQEKREERARSIRAFLKEPREDLQNRSPLYAGNALHLREALQTFLRELGQGMYDGNVPYSRHIEEIHLLFEAGGVQFRDVGSLPWENEDYLLQGQRLMDAMASRYFPRDRELALALWFQFSRERKPEPREHSVWAAATESLIARSVAGEMDAEVLEEIYGFQGEDLPQYRNSLETYLKEKDSLETFPPALSLPLDWGRQWQGAWTWIHKRFRGVLPEYHQVGGQLDRERVNSEEVVDTGPMETLLIQAREIEDPQEQIAFYDEVLKAGIREMENEGLQMGSEKLRENPKAYLYMQGKEELAQLHMEQGDYAGAKEHFETLLELEPEDEQMLRYPLSTCLLILDDEEAAEELFRRYPQEEEATWLYNKALHVFRKKGNSREANGVLQKALERNYHISVFLLNPQALEEKSPPLMVLAGVEEAREFTPYVLGAWKVTPGALGWLQGRVREG